ncbi:MAG: ABC transporter ATP-binding protein [Betaproteobacteria bacterium]
MSLSEDSQKMSMSKPPNVLEFEGVVVDYRKGLRGKSFRALHEIDLTVGRGEAVGFIGNNGAGKSTTLRVILGLQKVVSGRVCLNGLPPNDHESRRGVAYVPENPYLYDYLTPLELLKTGAKMHRCKIADDEKELRKHCMNWLERFDIAHVANKRIRSFSKGMTQRTALAHALACQPEFLILDEPLSGLDPIGRQEVVAILDEYRQLGGSLMFSSHVLNDVERLADRFIFIHQGKIAAACSTSEFLAAENPRFEIIVEAREKPIDFEPVSSRIWRREVPAKQLEQAIAAIQDGSNENRMILYSVRNMNGLERAYVKFVQGAQERQSN